MTVEDFVARVRSGFTSRPAFVVTKFGIILKEKPADEGLTVSEVTDMLRYLQSVCGLVPKSERQMRGP